MKSSILLLCLTALVCLLVQACAAEGGTVPNKVCFIESSSVSGRGEVSIKSTIERSTMALNEKMLGSGSISLERLRSIDRMGSVDSFAETNDLVFAGGILKGHKTVASHDLRRRLSASVTERFNLSQLFSPRQN
jgi:hypothetical protein